MHKGAGRPLGVNSSQVELAVACRYTHLNHEPRRQLTYTTFLLSIGNDCSSPVKISIDQFIWHNA